MEEITKTGNRTIIFVSHNMGAIQHLCKKCVLLESGRVKMIGDTSDVVKKHLDDSAGDSEIAFELTEERRSRTNGDIRFIKSVIQDENGNNIKNVYSGQNIKILLFYKGREDADLKNVRVNLNIDTPFGERVTSFYNHVVNSEFKQIPRNGHFIIDIPNFPLAPGTYPFTCYAMVSNSTSDWVTNAGHIEVANDKFFPSQDPMPEGQAIFYVKHSWSVEEDRQ
jgi:lipopolysaccharide transport system ATP-binding protein